MEEFFGIVPCTVMSMMSENLLPSACEVDICGTLEHVRADAGQRNAQRAARLEQQLRRRSRTRPSASTAPTCPSTSSTRREDGLPADHRRHRGQGEHLRHARRHGQSRRHELCALLHRRLRRHHHAAMSARATSPTIRSNTFGGAGVVEIPQHAESAALHLRERLRAPRRRQLLDSRPAAVHEAATRISAGTCTTTMQPEA